MANDLKSPKRKKKKKKSIGYKIFMSVLIILLAIIIIGTGYLLGTLNKLDNTKLNKDNLGIKTEEFVDYDTKNIKNIALFGIDSTDSNSGRSDSIMIVTIDSKHKKLKVSSIMRDSYVNIEGHGDDKINHAYAYGGPELAIKTINQNFGLNIENYATVDFSSLPAIIDLLGGVDIEIKEDELDYINEYINSFNSTEGTNSSNIYGTGVQHLDGIKALAYSRLRYTAGGDYERTHRHRTVLNALFKTLIDRPVTSYPTILSEILPYVQTNLGTSEILSTATNVLSIGNNLEQDRFPRDEDAVGTSIDGIYYLTFDRETVKQEIKDYIFNDIR